MRISSVTGKLRYGYENGYVSYDFILNYFILFIYFFFLQIEGSSGAGDPNCGILTVILTVQIASLVTYTPQTITFSCLIRMFVLTIGKEQRQLSEQIVIAVNSVFMLK